MCDRHARSCRSAHDLHVSAKLLCKPLDEVRSKAAAEPRSWSTSRISHTVVGYVQFPIVARHLATHDYAAYPIFGGERVFDRVHDQFGHDKPQVDGMGRTRFAAVCLHA